MLETFMNGGHRILTLFGEGYELNVVSAFDSLLHAARKAQGSGLLSPGSEQEAGLMSLIARLEQAIAERRSGR